MGEAIRSRREAAGLSLQAAAERARISPGYLFKLEGGSVTSPSPRVLHRVGGVLGMPYWELMRLAGYVPAGEGEPAKGGELAPPPKPARAATNERIMSLLEALRSELGELRGEHAGLRAAVEEALGRQAPDREAAERARDFLVSVAEGSSGFDLARLRDVRDRAWR
jgi:transcriptional regulator with XRE-family HTH domain